MIFLFLNRSYFMEIVTLDEFEKIKQHPGFHVWNTSLILSVICSYCDTPNFATAWTDETQVCKSCGADLKKGKLFVGMLGVKGIFLDLDPRS